MLKLNKNQLKKEYLTNRLNDYEIARKYGYSQVWVNKLRAKHKIKSLKPHERNPQQKLSKKQTELILGTLLGDASIKFSGRVGNKNGYLFVSHANKALTELKYNIMDGFVNAQIKTENRPNRKPMYYFKTISHPIFTKIYDKAYINGVKTIFRGWLDQLTPLSLSVWYMDDGSITRSGYQMRISTESFGYNEHLMIKKYFKEKWSIKVDIKPSPIKGKFILSFKAKERDKFFSLIETFIIPEMEYKIQRGSKSWEKWTIRELDYLKHNYRSAKTDWENMLKNLNHSKQAVWRKASDLGLGRWNFK